MKNKFDIGNYFKQHPAVASILLIVGVLVLLLLVICYYVSIFNERLVQREFRKAKNSEILASLMMQHGKKYPKIAEDAQIRLANRYILSKNFPEARKLYKYLEDHASAREIRQLAIYNHATTYIFEGNNSQAINELKKLLDESDLSLSIYSDANLNIAIQYFNLDKFQEALPYAENVLRVQHNNNPEIIENQQKALKMLEFLKKRNTAESS